MNIVLEFVYDRSTKNKELYREVTPDNAEDKVGALYIRRSALGATRPRKLLVEIKVSPFATNADIIKEELPNV